MGSQRMRIPRQTRRWLVHLVLIATAIISLVFEPRLKIHILLGLLFSIFVGLHIVQRKKISRVLMRQFTQFRAFTNSLGRMAFSDLVLLCLTFGMLISGFYDWWLGHPTVIRWHAIFGVLLTIDLVVHSLRRRNRLRSSRIQ